MATKERFSISMDPDVRRAVKAHADEMGLDVSAYVVAAVRRQMTEDRLVAERWSRIDSAIVASETAPASSADGDGDGDGHGDDLSPEEIAAARAGIARAMAPDSQESAA
ncbi:hypothetical protein ACEZCY_30520 [Streptacidiphilus sp. N1-12]|uniref:Uncharacterized protein n=2 Tax=Streptacidiphilus alkalitolerans TaxID=3342712 RepID=A0ABV6VIB2_9ACTN